MLKEALERETSKKEKEKGVIAGVNVEYADASEKRKLSTILNKLKKIPTGQKTLKNLAEYGTLVSLVPISAWGAFCSDENRIYLRSAAKTNKLCSTLVHEARHATQHARTENKALNREDYDLETQICLDRAKEADAQVFAYQAVSEWAQAGDQKPFQEFNEAYPGTYNFYFYQKREKKFKENTDEARSVLFRAFFEEKKRVASYEDLYINQKALSDFAQCINGEQPDTQQSGVHLTVDQVAAITCGEYMADYDTFLRSDKAMGLTMKTKSVLEMLSAVQGKDFGANDLPLSSRQVGLLDVNDIATSPVGDVRNSAVKVLKAATGLNTRSEIEVLYKEPVEKQAETVKAFGEKERDAFRRGKIAERCVRYFYNLSDISAAETILRITGKEDKKAESQKIITEKTAENKDFRDYITVASFIENNRKKNPALAAEAMNLTELSESVKKELRFDNTVLAKPLERSASALTKEDEKALNVLRKSLSGFTKGKSLVMQKTLLAKKAER